MKINSPLIETEELSNCIICGSNDFSSFAGGYDYESETCSNLWQFVQCKKCTHIWLNPKPGKNTLNIIYPATYYAYNYENTINPIAQKGKEILDSFKMREILNSTKKSVTSYMDVGCGNGRFLKFMEKEKTEIPKSKLYGIDLDKKSLESLIKEGYQVFSSRIEDCNSISKNQIDLITMFHVIEHIEDPKSILKKVKEWLSPGGIFAIETPNTESLDAKLFKSGFWGGYHIPRHWHFFKEETIKKILTSCGYEIVSVKYQTGHSFWMFSFHHMFKYGKNKFPLLAKMFDPFSSSGLPLLIAFSGFDKLRSIFRFKTSSMLVIARRPATSQT